MKQLLPFFSFALFLTACNTGEPKQAEVAAKQETTAPVLDTAGLASYQAWKAQKELMEVKQAEAAEETSKPVTYKIAEQRTYAYAPKTQKRTSPAPEASSSAPVTKENTETSNSTADSGSGTTGTGSTEGTAKAEEKKGMSKATKGAVIGGVAGAAAGAVLVKKNRAAGAVIGGVVGAIGGHVIGKKMDQKDGRTQ